MVRTCYVQYEDNEGTLHDYQVEYIILFDNEQDSVIINSVKENDIEVALSDEDTEELKNLCFEDYDDDNWEYDE